MRRVKLTLGLAALAACACTQRSQEQAATKAPETANVISNQAAPAIPPPGTGPNARTPFAETKGAIDPKSAEAAGQVVQHYGALIEQRRFADAEKYWNDPASAAKVTLELRRYPEAHLEIGDLGDAEGAAGSIYVTVPVSFYGKDRNGSAFKRAADLVLRRVNDVPGSTAEQRRWHIERIDWKA